MRAHDFIHILTINTSNKTAVSTCVKTDSSNRAYYNHVTRHNTETGYRQHSCTSGMYVYVGADLEEEIPGSQFSFRSFWTLLHHHHHQTKRGSGSCTWIGHGSFGSVGDGSSWVW